MPSSPETIGLIGVFLTLIAYLLLSVRKMRPEKFFYPFLNALGSILILYSLYFHRNISATVMELCWLLISLYSVLKAIRRSTHF